MTRPALPLKLTLREWESVLDRYQGFRALNQHQVTATLNTIRAMPSIDEHQIKLAVADFESVRHA